MVNYRKIVEQLKEDGPLSLFVVVQMDELVDTWTVIFAAERVNDRNIHEIYKKISNLIDDNGNKSEIAKVSRIGIFRNDHYLVKGLLEYGEEELKNVKINGNIIHYGFVYYPRYSTKKDKK